MMTPESLLGRLKSATDVPSLVFGFGDETQRLIDGLDALEKWAKQREGFEEKAFISIENQSDFDWFLMDYQSQSLFCSKRVVLVQWSLKVTTAVAEKLISIVNHPNPDVLLIIRAGDLDKGTKEAKWFKAIDQAGWVIHSQALTAEAVPKWLQSVAASLHLQMTPDAAQLLSLWSEGNLLSAKQSLLRWQLQGQMNITVALLEQDEQDWARFDVFALVNQIVKQNAKQSIRILSRLKESGEDAVLILWALSREVRLWQSIMQDPHAQQWTKMAQQYRLWGERSDRLRGLMGRLQSERVNQWLMDFLRIDREIKGQSQQDPWQSLQLLVIELSTVTRK